MISRMLLGAGLGLCLTTSAVLAQPSGTAVATKSDWQVYVAEKPKQCWIVSKPKSTVNTRGGKTVSVNRGDIFIFVSFFPNQSGGMGEVSFLGGYDFKKGSTVKLTVGDKSFDLFTDGGTAWATSSEQDKAISAAMKAGADAILQGTSDRSGTDTKDTFSLTGFTAAYEDAAGRCK